MIVKILHTIFVFLIETFLQVLYYTLVIRYFNEFRWDTDFWGIFKDALYFVGSVKAVFFLPVYLLFYLVVAKKLGSVLKIALAHSLLFFILFFLAFVFLSVNLFRPFYHSVVLTGIAFLVSFFYLKIFSFPVQSVRLLKIPMDNPN
jgi:hypothetical protein